MLAFVIFQGAVGKAKECQKQVEDAKITESEMLSILQRADIISFGTLAEMTHFQKERVVDFKIMMQAYLKQQIIFYQEVSLSFYSLYSFVSRTPLFFICNFLTIHFDCWSDLNIFLIIQL